MKTHPLAVVLGLGLGLLGAVAAMPAHSRTVEQITAYRQEAQYPGEVARRTYFLATAASEKEMLEFRRELMRRGARHVNFFVPDVIVCELPATRDILSDVRMPAVTRHEETAIDSGPGPGMSAPQADRIAEVRSAYELSERTARPAVPVVPGDAFTDVVIQHSPERVREVKHELLRIDGSAAQQQRNLDQNSEFLSGDILAIFVMPESNGLRESNTHDWTDQELALAAAGASSAMLAFQSTHPNMPMHFVFKVYERVDCDYEPILHNMNDDGPTWIMDTMRSLGYGQGSDPAAAGHRLNNDLRAQYGTDWVFTGLVANSKHAPNNIFLGADYTAYAFLGGPYLVIPYPAGRDPNGIGTALIFSQIYQHESGHSFWALDEYQGAPGTCDDASGYLDYENQNIDIVGPIGIATCYGVDCIMKYAAREDIGRPWCLYTQGMTGVVDADDNGIPDIFQSRPRVQFVTSQKDTVEESSITIRLNVISDPVPNQNPRQADEDRVDYAMPLGGGQYIHPKGLEKVLLKPVDGKWDEFEEEVEFTVDNLPVGQSKVLLEFDNALGYSSHDPRAPQYAVEVIYLGINYHQFGLVVKPGSIIALWGVITDEFTEDVLKPTFDLHRVGSDGEDVLVAEDVQPSGPKKDGILPYRFIDRTIEPGTDYTYYVRSNFGLSVGGVYKEYHPESPHRTQTAMVPLQAPTIMSRAAPNPFNPDRDGTTKVSLAVPPTFQRANDVEGAPEVRVATTVEVIVYDVSGRRIKTLRSGGVQLDVITVRWDGTNEAGVPAPAGVYFIRAKAADQRGAQKVLLIK